MTAAWITPQAQYLYLLQTVCFLIAFLIWTNLLQEVIPKPFINDKQLNMKDYKVLSIPSNLGTYDDGNKIDLGDKTFQVQILVEIKIKKSFN